MDVDESRVDSEVSDRVLGSSGTDLVEDVCADAPMDDNPWSDYCMIEEAEARQWVCDLEAQCREESAMGDFEEGDGGLDPAKVAAARAEEVSYMHQRGLWDVVPVPPGVYPVSVRWVDVVKGDGSTRSRLVARDFKGDDRGRDDLFVATPPLEAFRVVLSRAVTETSTRERRRVVFIDAKKAHLNPRCHEDVYIELPVECGAPPGMCGKLRFWLYGFRRAASEWEQHYASLLESAGFVRGAACPVLFYHPGRDISLAVHGDDFVAAGLAGDLAWLTDYLQQCFEIKVRAVLGDGPHFDKEVVMLGRTVRWTQSGVEIEADPKHRRLLMEGFGLDDSSKGLMVNGEAKIELDQDSNGIELVTSEATAFRALVARLNFLSQDNPELQFPAKELSRDMAHPTVGSWSRLKKTVRFLVSRRRVVWRFDFQEDPGRLRVYTDSDWGGDRLSRKSTTGGAICFGGHCLRTWSSTQGAIALSSAEAEFYALVDGALRAKWTQSVLCELGWPVSPAAELCTDSSAAKSFISRRV